MSNERDGAAEAIKMIGAGVVGAIVAGGLALLLAPKAGRELRDDLRETTSGATEKLAEASHTIAAKVKEKAVEIKDKATEAAQSAVAKVQEECEPAAEEGGTAEEV